MNSLSVLNNPEEENAFYDNSGGNTSKKCSKKPGCCESEKEIGYSVSQKVACCSTEKKDKLKGKIKTGGCTDVEKVIKSSPSVDFGSFVDKKVECCVVENQPCRSSEDKNNRCDLKKKACSSGKQEPSCCANVQVDNLPGQQQDRCCVLNQHGLSDAKKSECYDLTEPDAATCSTQPCCSKTGIGSSTTKAPGNFSCDADNFDSDERSKGACADDPVLDRFYERTAKPLDVEKGAISLEHVVLDIQGLTCTGCETKLFKSLQGIPGIRNLRTSLVLSQAEFDFDENAGLVAEVIISVEKATGFTCQRLNNKGQEIEVVVEGDVKVFVERKYPNGVLQVVASDKQTVRITYDAKIIGVRGLLDKYDDGPLRLAAPRESSELESGGKHLRTTAWTTLASAILTVPVLVMAWAPLPPQPIAYGGASLALATIVQFAIAGPFYPSALRALLFTHVIEMDLLIVLSTSIAYIFSLVSYAYQVIGHPLPTGEFFETSTLLVTLIMLGRLVSAFARLRAVNSVSIRTLQADTAVLCDVGGTGDQQVDARLLQYGDLFKVAPESRITTDGVIILGTTEVDESMVTGESLPVEKLPGSSVIAGSLNGSGVIVVRLTHLPGNNTISTIATMVDEAKFSKPKTQELVDFIASYFVPVILILSIMTFAVWIAVGMSVRHQSGGHAVVNAITYAISVLIVSCPCAIGLAVPMVIVISGGVAAKHGVVFKSATAIEIARKVSHVVFDKTGTLTRGELSVVKELYLSEKHDFAASITLGLTCDSKHPVSAAISSYLRVKGVKAAQITDHKSIPGNGVQGTFDGASVRCGNTRWLSAQNVPEVQTLLTKSLTVFCVALNDQPILAFGLTDSLRPDTRAVIAELQNRNIAISIISGDDAGAVNDIAFQLNIPANRVRSCCTPSAKQAYLKTLMTHPKNPVLFCGDGTNDAAALAQADIGVHIRSGSDVARTAADVVLMRPSLSGILVLLDLSAAAYRRILFNFAWSGVYNLFAVLLAGGAFVHARISPQYAGLGEIVSVLPVILVALQLKRFKSG